ncbi:hypothetical protein P7C73_g1919, partial [Tremellales sp. Uapishka_1]
MAQRIIELPPNVEPQSPENRKRKRQSEVPIALEIFDGENEDVTRGVSNEERAQVIRQNRRYPLAAPQYQPFMLALTNFNGFEAWLQMGPDRLVEHQKEISKAKDGHPCTMTCFVECEIGTNVIRNWKRGGLDVRVELDGRKLPSKRLKKGQLTTKCIECSPGVGSEMRIEGGLKSDALEASDTKDNGLVSRTEEQLGTIAVKVFRTYAAPRSKKSKKKQKGRGVLVPKLDRAHGDSKNGVLEMGSASQASKKRSPKGGKARDWTQHFHDQAVPWLVMLFKYGSRACLRATGDIDDGLLSRSTLVWQSDMYAPVPSTVSMAFPDPDPIRGDYHEWNNKAIRELITCMARGDCGVNQEKVVLCHAHVFPDAVINNWKGGEGVWALSVYKAMRQLGYTVLLGMNQWDETIAQYRMFPDLVKIVIKSDSIDNCINDQKCIKSDENPTGIPRWKSELPHVSRRLATDVLQCEMDRLSRRLVANRTSFYFSFFPIEGVYADLGKKWILHADRLRMNDEETGLLQYIGYSFEEECNSREMVPHSERPLSGWAFAKQATLFYMDHKNFVFNRSFFELASQEPRLNGMTFKGAYQINPDYFPQWIVDGPLEPIPAIENLGKLDPEAFTDELANTRMIIGSGTPTLSPSPYLGLCLGTPFLNPIKSWDESDPDDRTKWLSQHEYLKWLDPPYVYNVRAQDFEGFIAALEGAVANPPPRYIDPPMTDAGVRGRVERLVETDWKAVASEIVERRKAEGETFTRSAECPAAVACREVITPLPPLNPPPTPKQRTPSILRSLAHHPSLSALKSRSRRNKTPRSRKPIPDLPTSRSAPLQGEREQESPLKSTRSKSVPQDLSARGSTEGETGLLIVVVRGSGANYLRSGEERRSSVELDLDPFPPFPTSTPDLRNRTRSLSRPPRSSTPAAPRSTVSPLHRKPVPQVKVHGEDFCLNREDDERYTMRMQLEVEVESPGKRRRGKSMSEASPRKPNAARHLSSPAPPTHYSATPPMPHTMEHPRPHPVPLNNLSASHFLREGFEPMSSTGYSLDDALRILVANEELPSGTPGGKKEDLQRGVLVDGQRREKGALRFFSRDLRGPMSSTPNSSTSHGSLTPYHVRQDTLTPTPDARKSSFDSRRSASPFEVMLSPLATKRMSLDAFGAGSPVAFDLNRNNHGEAHEEEVLQDDDETGEMEQIECGETSLSTIEEWSGERNQSVYHTPGNLPPSREMDSSLNLRHASAPPLGLTLSLLGAHGDHARALNKEIRACKTVIEVLLDEKTRREMEEEMKSSKIGELERRVEILGQKNEEQSRVIQESKLLQGEDQDFIDSLQTAHDDLVARVTELEEERQRDATTLNRSFDVRTDLETKLNTLLDENSALKADHWTLNARLAEVESQLEATGDDYSATLMENKELQAEMERKKQTIDDLLSSKRRDETVAQSLKMDLNEQERTISELKDHLATYSFKSDERVIIQRSTSVLRIGELETEVDRMMNIIQTQSDTIERLSEEVKAHQLSPKGRVGSEASAAAAKERELLELNKRVQDLEAEIVGLEEERSRWEEEEVVWQAEREDWDAERRCSQREKEMWAEEKTELVGALDRASTEAEKSTALELQLFNAQRDLASLQADFEHQTITLAAKIALVRSREDENSHLRSSNADFEEALVRQSEEYSKSTKESAKTTESLICQIADLDREVDSLRAALKETVLKATTEMTGSEGVKSKLSTFGKEIDRLCMDREKLKNEVAELRAKSGMDGMQMNQLEVKFKRLEEEKELLNVALESKQIELALVQRKSRTIPSTPSSRPRDLVTPTPTNHHRNLATPTLTPGSTSSRRQTLVAFTPRHLAASTSVTQQTPSRRSAGAEETPIASRRLSNSTSIVHSVKRAVSVRREPIAAPALARTVLGSSTRQNADDSESTPKLFKVAKGGLYRRSSLPVLKRSSLSVPKERVSSLVEEDEVVG